MSVIADHSSHGTVVASFRPFSVGISGGIPVSASWPFPRRLDVYGECLSFQALGSSAIVPKAQILRIRVAFGTIRVEWADGAHRASAALTDPRRVTRIAAVLRGAGYAVESKAARR